MIRPLEGQKPMNRSQRARVCRDDAKGAATRQRSKPVPDAGAPRRHDICPWHIFHMHKRWHTEVAGAERLCNTDEVAPDFIDTYRIVHIALKRYTSTVGQRHEPMR